MTGNNLNGTVEVGVDISFDDIYSSFSELMNNAEDILNAHMRVTNFIIKDHMMIGALDADKSSVTNWEMTNDEEDLDLQKHSFSIRACFNVELEDLKSKHSDESKVKEHIVNLLNKYTEISDYTYKSLVSISDFEASQLDITNVCIEEMENSADNSLTI